MVGAAYVHPSKELKIDRRAGTGVRGIGVNHDPVAPRAGKDNRLTDAPGARDVGVVVLDVAVVGAHDDQIDALVGRTARSVGGKRTAGRLLDREGELGRPTGKNGPAGLKAIQPVSTRRRDVRRGDGTAASAAATSQCARRRKRRGKRPCGPLRRTPSYTATPMPPYIRADLVVHVWSSGVESSVVSRLPGRVSGR